MIGTERSEARSFRDRNWVLPGVIVTAISSMLLVAYTFVQLGGELSTETSGLKVLADAQRDSLMLQVALERLDIGDDLGDVEVRLGLLQRQAGIILLDRPDNAALNVTFDAIETELASIALDIDQLDNVSNPRWPDVLESARLSAALLERDTKRIYDAASASVAKSVARDAAAKQNSQRLLLALSGITLGMATGLGATQWRRARSSVLRALADLTASEERFRSLVQHSSDLVLVIEADGRIAYCSPAAERVLGPGTSLTGVQLAAVVHPSEMARVETALRRAVDTDGRVDTIEFQLRHRDGTWRDMESTLTNLLASPAVGGLVLNTRDVTERTQLESELRRLAFHDDLTRLANRALFLDRLRHAGARVQRHSSCHAVLLIDLDGFKLINDSLGHGTGDALLVDVAHRLLSNVAPEHTVARLGGDEFAVLIEDIQGAGDATEIADRLVRCLGQPYTVGNHRRMVTASIGVAISSPDADTDFLLRNADLAMYVAKRLGRDRAETYEPWMLSTAIERMDLERELVQALDADEFVVHYQPLVRLESAAVYGFEALVRWMHPVRGLVSPNTFISVAEETGLIIPLGARILDVAVMQAVTWQRETGLPLTISVNVSTRQLEDPAFPVYVADLLGRAGLMPNSLVLEITESELVRSGDSCVRVLEHLRGLGIRVAIDDFGTGYSSLSYLRDLPVDILKLDKSFVDGFRHGTRSVVGEAVIALCNTLELDLVAEGIEHAEQRDTLLRLHCTNGQGFLFAKPASADIIQPLIAELAAQLNPSIP